MPSSGPPGEFTRRARRFFYTGISLLPQDALAEGKVAYIRNMRSYQEGTLTVRDGSLATITTGADPVHSFFRLDNPTTANGPVNVRYLGTGTTLQRSVVGSGTSASAITGFSGQPLNGLTATPAFATEPFLYLGDAAQQRKISAAGTVYPLGISAPTTPPTAALAQPQRTDLQAVDSGFWTSYGGQSTPLAPTVTPVAPRVTTTLTHYLPDAAEPAMASFALESFDNVVAGMLLTLGAETAIVQAINPPVSPTTVAGILYDAGSTGLCCIQPTGSFEAGQTEPVEDEVIRHRYGNLTAPIPPRTTVTRTIDFPVDSLVDIGGEVTRILSVSQGTDGVLSFRCRLTSTVAAGAAISGVASLRAYATVAHAVSEAVTASQTSVTVTATDLESPVVGGFQTPIAPPAAWGRIGARASAPDDLIRVNIRISQMGYVEAVRLMLDLQPDPLMTSEPYTRDYFFYEWRASDLVAAIQAQTEIATAQIIDAQAVATQRGDVNSQYIDQFGNASGPFVPPPGTAGNRRARNPGGTSAAGPVQGTSAGQPNGDGLGGDGGSYRTGRYALERDGSVPMSHGLSRQLALGNDVWMTLECRVADLVRVGTDTTKTLQGVENAAIYFQSKGWVEPITFDLGDCYLTGGYGPDAGVTLPPYVYRYRYRSTITGERGNASPPMRAGVSPRRQRVQLAAASSVAPQVDVIDFYRFGGALSRWTYVGTVGNSSPTLNDDTSDAQIDGGETIELDRFAIWPVADAPRSGTATVAGTSVVSVSGDSFNTAWSADSLITINGRTTGLYAPPSSSSRLELSVNVGSGTAVTWTMPSPTLLAQPLPGLWGGAFGNVWVHFGCGSAADPGLLAWTYGNDPDAASDAFVLRVTSASEPLLNGFFDDGQCFVFSSNRLFRVLPTFGDPLAAFRVVDTACSKGLWGVNAFAVSPYGTFFVAADGIYLTQAGSEAISITDPDLRILFPQDGAAPEAIRGIAPIDFSAPARLRLAYVDHYLYFDYLAIDGTSRTFVYEPNAKRWSYDEYPESYAGVYARTQEPGAQVRTHLFGAGNGVVYEVRADQLTDDVEVLPWEIWTPWEHGDDPRAMKQWGDYILDVNPGGALSGITATPVTANGLLVHTPTIVGTEETLRNTYLVEINDGIGPYARNTGLQISGFCELCDTQRPLLYLWEPAWLSKGTITARRATDWDDLGYKGAKFIQGIVIRANTFAAEKCVAVEYDSPNGDPTVSQILTLAHDGEREVAYPLAEAGWTPFTAHLVRLHGVDDQDWILQDWRWVWEPEPEAATQWETQWTSCDFPGYFTLHDAVLAYAASAEILLSIWHDTQENQYYLPPTTSASYMRRYTRFQRAKGKAVKFRFTSPAPFRIYQRDCVIRAQGWGILGGYQSVQPFGGPSRVDGAAI